MCIFRISKEIWKSCTQPSMYPSWLHTSGYPSAILKSNLVKSCLLSFFPIIWKFCKEHVSDARFENDWTTEMDIMDKFWDLSLIWVSEKSLQWHHNEWDGVSNHQPHDCLFNHLFKAQSKENIQALRHWPLWGEFTGDRWIPLTKGQ